MPPHHPGAPHTTLFLHVMKTGGTSLHRYLIDNFRVGEIDPDQRIERTEADYASLTRLWSMTPEQRSRLRVISGHYPYFVTDLIQPDETITVLRHPVDRTISMLRQLCAEQPPTRHRSIEEIYDDPSVRSMLIDDYQAKLFGMSTEDWEYGAAVIRAVRPDRAHAGHLAHLMTVPVTAERLDRAVTNLGRVDVVGFQHRYDDFLREVSDRYGWTIDGRHRLRQARSEAAVPSAFRRRIEDDNAADMAFYTAALELADRRHHS